MLKSCVLVIYISYTQKFVPEAMRKSYEYNVVTFQKKESYGKKFPKKESCWVVGSLIR